MASTFEATRQDTEYSVERPRARAILLSARGLGAFIIDAIEAFTTTKDDGGDAGTFTITAPLLQNPDAAAASGPMDIIALFADRSIVDESGNAVDGTKVGPLTTDGLSYGSIATIQTLGNDPTCVFIGMIDKPHHGFTMSDTPVATFRIEGRDLTKVFLDNDTDIPFIATGSLAYGSLAQLQIAREGRSGPELLTSALDVMVSKNGFAKDNPNIVLQPPGSAAAGLVPLAKFGYPWRDFVRTDKLDFSFLSFAGNRYPPFNLQDGPAWGCVMELKNDPLCRLFVDETGALIFDDSYKAWTRAGTPVVVKPDDVRDADIYKDDSNIIGFLTIQPFTAELNSPVANAVGVAIKPYKQLQIISTYGYRIASWQSYYDLDNTSADLRAPTLWALHNDLFHCQITLKGKASYHAGTRIKLAGLGGMWPETIDATWYGLDCQHQWTWGNDWTTTMHLRFPRHA